MAITYTAFAQKKIGEKKFTKLVTKTWVPEKFVYGGIDQPVEEIPDGMYYKFDAYGRLENFSGYDITYSEWDYDKKTGILSMLTSDGFTEQVFEWGVKEISADRFVIEYYQETASIPAITIHLVPQKQ